MYLKPNKKSFDKLAEEFRKVKQILTSFLRSSFVLLYSSECSILSSSTYILAILNSIFVLNTPIREIKTKKWSDSHDRQP